MAKLVDALDLGSSGATHQSSNLCTRTKIFFFNVLGNCVEMTGLVLINPISHRTRTHQDLQSVEKQEIIFSCI